MVPRGMPSAGNSSALHFTENSERQQGRSKGSGASLHRPPLGATSFGPTRMDRLLSDNSSESSPSKRKPPRAETSDWIPNSRDATPQSEESAHRTAETRYPPPRTVHIPIPEPLLNAREVAARLGVSERWVRDHTTRRAPKLRGVKLGSLMRYRNVDVEDFMEKLATSRSSVQPRFGG